MVSHQCLQRWIIYQLSEEKKQYGMNRMPWKKVCRRSWWWWTRKDTLGKLICDFRLLFWVHVINTVVCYIIKETHSPLSSSHVILFHNTRVICWFIPTPLAPPYAWLFLTFLLTVTWLFSSLVYSNMSFLSVFWKVALIYLLFLHHCQQ